MTLFSTILAELQAAGLEGERLLAAFARIELAAGFVTGGDAVHRRGRPGNSESAGARRTRSYRARLLVAPASQIGIVTDSDAVAASDVPRENAGFAGVSAIGPMDASALQVAVPVTTAGFVTICDAEPKKEVPPHPLKKKPNPQSPPGSAPRHKPSRQPLDGRQRPKRRNPFEAGTPAVDPRRHVAGNTPLHFELLRLSGKASVPDMGTGGWLWDPQLIAEAERRLESRVTTLRPPSSQQDPPEDVLLQGADTG